MQHETEKKNVSRKGKNFFARGKRLEKADRCVGGVLKNRILIIASFFKISPFLLSCGHEALVKDLN